MIFIKDVQSTVRPLEVDLDSSHTTKYVRTNIRQEQVGENAELMWVYDEEQYTTEEYCVTKTREIDELKDTVMSMKSAFREMLGYEQAELLGL